jgi:nucleotide-binding universal stress UspA family protein
VSLFEKILVPLDGSEQSIWALGKAIQIAKRVNGEITLIHVYSISPTAITPMQVYKYAQAMRKHGIGILEDGKKKAEAEGVQAQTLLVDGHTVEEILNAAKEGNFSLIVIGARGLSKMKELLLGSVSDAVTRLAPCPVLVIR